MFGGQKGIGIEIGSGTCGKMSDDFKGSKTCPDPNVENDAVAYMGSDFTDCQLT